MNQRQDGWSEYEKLVLFRLTNLEQKMDVIDKHVVQLQIKAAVWGALAGLGISLIPVILNALL